jgi:hypothetical protein
VIVDDPDRKYGNQSLPEVISAQELAAKTQTGYLLRTVPDGYSLQISAPPVQSANEPYIYFAFYRTEPNGYFVIEAAPGQAVSGFDVNETYTTASGLALYFEKDSVYPPSEKKYVSALVVAPGGATLMIKSTLPRETVKVWAEELVLAK